MSHRGIAARCRSIAVKLANAGTVVARIPDASTHGHDNRHKKFRWALKALRPAPVDVRRHIHDAQVSSGGHTRTLVWLIVPVRCQTSAAKRQKGALDIVAA